MKKNLITKIICLVVALALGAIAGVSFHEQRYFKETVVVSDALTDVYWLSDYEPLLKGTAGDTPIFVFDSGVEGGSLLIGGGTHPYEPACSVATYVIMENLKVDQGIVYVIPQQNMSATTTGVQGNAYPPYMHIETEWGEAAYKIGERNTNPLDQWPDNFTYINYPSKQSQANNDLRNLNRCYPGRPDGTFTERVAWAIMEFIRTEKVDVSFDFHEASIMYPVVNVYVAHNRAADLAMWSQMTITEYDMKYEDSPKSLKGFTHREWGDYTEPQNWPANSRAELDESWPGTLAILMETPEPFIDRIVGPITEDLMLDGHDLFLSFAGDKGLTYAPYNEANGYSHPLEFRVGRHLTGVQKVLENLPMFYPDIQISASWPGYTEITTHELGVGGFLHDPKTADAKQVYEIGAYNIFEFKG